MSRICYALLTLVEFLSVNLALNAKQIIYHYFSRYSVTSFFNLLETSSLKGQSNEMLDLHAVFFII